jgi:hypothetical protein
VSYWEHSLFRVPRKLLASYALLTSAEGASITSNGTQSYEKDLVVQLLPYGSRTYHFERLAP